MSSAHIRLTFLILSSFSFNISTDVASSTVRLWHRSFPVLNFLHVTYPEISEKAMGFLEVVKQSNLQRMIGTLANGRENFQLYKTILFKEKTIVLILAGSSIHSGKPSRTN